MDEKLAPRADTREDVEGLALSLMTPSKLAFWSAEDMEGLLLLAEDAVAMLRRLHARALAAESALAEARAEIERIKAAFDAYHASVMGNLRALLTPSHTPSQPRSEADDDLGPVTAEGMAMVRERAAAGLAGRTFSSIYASQPRSDSLSGGDGAEAPEPRTKREELQADLARIRVQVEAMPPSARAFLSAQLGGPSDAALAAPARRDASTPNKES